MEQVVRLDRQASDDVERDAERRGYEAAAAEAVSWLERHYGGQAHAEAVIGPLSRWMANRARQRWGGR